jgi:hypothetical protein
LLRLKDTHLTNRIRPVLWTVENIARLERVNNKFMCAVDFWLDNVTTGLITEFSVDTVKSYTVANEYFLRGPRGRYIRSFYTSIKILLHDKGMMTMNQTSRSLCVHGGVGGSTKEDLRNGEGSRV